MSAQAHPRPRRAVGGIGPFGYNLALLLGCVLPVSGTAAMGLLWMHGKVANLHDGLGGLGFIYVVSFIPVAVFGIFYLVFAMPMADMYPAWAREIALAAMAVCFVGLMALGSPLDADTRPGWIGLGATMAAWGFAIKLKPGTRVTETEWVVAVAPGLLLAAATAMYEYTLGR